MMEKLSTEYKNLLFELKAKVRSAQIKAAIAVNSELIHFYWELGKSIAEKENVWGSKLIEQVSKDLQSEFPDMKGFSETNLKYCRLFYNYFSTSPQPEDEFQISPQLEDDLLKLAFYIPWGHIKMLIGKIKDKKTAKFYMQKCIENNWSRDVLDLQIKSDLYNRQGKSINNFKATMPEPLSDLAIQTFKDPYIFDFLTLANGY